MKILLTLIFILAGLAIGAKAQLCGTYSTSVLVLDEAGKPVGEAEVKIIPQQKKDDTRKKEFVRQKENAARLFVLFNEGELIKGSYKIVVSAKGFLPAEKIISFPHCESQLFEFRLKTGGTLIQPTLARRVEEELPEKPNTTRLCGTLFAQNRAIISGVTIKAKSYKKGIFKTTTDEEGNFEIEVPDGLYKIIIKQRGFKKVVMKKQSLPYEPISCRNYILISTVKKRPIT